MQIGELARSVGVSTKTIRYYEGLGLLYEPVRLPNGYRSYDERTVERLRFIRDAQASGLTLTEIGAILELRERGASTCEHVIDLLEQHLETLDRHIADLQRSRQRLMGLTDRARSLDPGDCTDPERCQTIQPADQSGPGVTVHTGPGRHHH